MRIITFISTAVLFLCAPAVAATVVYDNGSPNQKYGYEMTHYMQADDIIVTPTSGSITFDTLRFWTLEPAGGAQYNGQIVWVINTDAGGYPHYNMVSMTAGPISRTYVQSISSGLWAGYDEYQYDLSITTPVTLTPTATYWFSLHNGDYSLYSSDQSFYWETTDNNGTNGSYNFVRTGTPPGPWIANSGVAGATEAQLAYQLLLNTPEPGSWLMLAGGGLMLAWRRRGR